MTPSFDEVDHEGLRKPRKCTDVVCLFLFILCMGTWLCVGLLLVMGNSIEEVFAPHDMNNNVCGLGENADSPYLLYFDVSKCMEKAGQLICNTPSICVKNCPVENFDVGFYRNSGKFAVSYVAKKLYCIPSVSKKNLNVHDIESLIRNKSCTSWYIRSTPVSRVCIPGYSFKEEMKMPIEGLIHQFNISTTNYNMAIDILHALSTLNELSPTAAKFIIMTRNTLAFCFLICILLSALYIIVMSALPRLMVWLSFLLVIALIFTCVYLSSIAYMELIMNDGTDIFPYPAVQEFKGNTPLISRIKNVLYQKLFAYIVMLNTWKAFTTIALLVLMAMLLLAFFLRNRLILATDLIYEGSKVIFRFWSLLYFPTIFGFIQISLLAYAVVFSVYLFITGQPIYYVNNLDGDSDCHCSDPYYKDAIFCLPSHFAKSCRNKLTQKACSLATCVLTQREANQQVFLLQVFNTFCLFWSLCFVAALQQLILSNTYAAYYYYGDKKHFSKLWMRAALNRVFRYNLGTAAIGSILVSLFSCIRIVFELLEAIFEKCNNKCIDCVKKSLCCCHYSLKYFLHYMNSNAFIMCSLQGENFFRSTSQAQKLYEKYPSYHTLLDKVAHFLLFATKLVISLSTGLFAYYIFTYPGSEQLGPDSSPLQATFYFYPIFFALFGAYFISSNYVNLFGVVVSTFNLCYVDDLAINEDTPEKSYCATKEINALFKRAKEKLVPKTQPEDNAEESGGPSASAS